MGECQSGFPKCAMARERWKACYEGIEKQMMRYAVGGAKTDWLSGQIANDIFNFVPECDTIILYSPSKLTRLEERS